MEESFDSCLSCLLPRFFVFWYFHRKRSLVKSVFQNPIHSKSALQKPEKFPRLRPAVFFPLFPIFPLYLKFGLYAFGITHQIRIDEFRGFFVAFLIRISPVLPLKLSTNQPINLKRRAPCQLLPTPDAHANPQTKTKSWVGISDRHYHDSSFLSSPTHF